MPVNYATPAADQLFPVAGVRLGVAEAEIRKKNRRDLTLVALDAGCTVAGVFTQNRFCAAPVQLCRNHLAAGKEIRALVINTGIANAGTGEPGRQTAQASCAAVAELLGIAADQVLPFSTGVILEPLPVDRLKAGLPAARADLRADNWHAAAHAIMTTDTLAKAASRRVTVGGKTISISGISKGAGMIKPNMATMLGFVATDAGIAQAMLDKLVKEAADASFELLALRHLGGVPHFYDVISYRTMVESRINAMGARVVVTEAVVKVKIDDEQIVRHAVDRMGEGSASRAAAEQLGGAQQLIPATGIEQRQFHELHQVVRDMAGHGQSHAAAFAEGGAHDVERVAVGAEPALDLRDDVHDVRIALDHHVFGEFDRPHFGNPPGVVAAKVKQLDMFGALFLVGQQILFQRQIFFKRDTAPARSGNRTHGDGIAFEPNEDFRRSANNEKILEIEVEHVRRGVERTQGTVKRQRAGGKRFAHALRENHLHDITFRDVVLGLQNGLLELRFTEHRHGRLRGSRRFDRDAGRLAQLGEQGLQTRLRLLVSPGNAGLGIDD